MEKDLTAAFLETSYIAYLDTEIVLKVGQLPDTIVQNYPHIKSWAFITAWNPLPERLDAAQNKQRNDDLRAHLVQAAYVFHPGVGVSKDKDWSEDSFFIENIELQRANEISKMFGQLAFIYGDCQTGNQLIFTR